MKVSEIARLIMACILGIIGLKYFIGGFVTKSIVRSLTAEKFAKALYAREVLLSKGENMEQIPLPARTKQDNVLETVLMTAGALMIGIALALVLYK